MMPDQTASTIPNQLSVHYIKGNHFRVVHSDGIIGGLTPRGLIHFAIYSERPAIPQVVVQALTPKGELGEELSRMGREGIVRELEVDVLMAETVAQAFHKWLGERLKEVQRVRAESGRTEAAQQGDRDE